MKHKLSKIRKNPSNYKVCKVCEKINLAENIKCCSFSCEADKFYRKRFRVKRLIRIEIKCLRKEMFTGKDARDWEINV